MCRNNACLISIAISIVLAVAAAIAFFIGELPGIIAFVIATLILAALGALSIILVKGYRDNYCLCNNGICLVIGIAGTLLLGIIALSITLTVGVILSAILIGLLGFFAGLTLTNLVILLLCVSKTSCGHKEC